MREIETMGIEPSGPHGDEVPALAAAEVEHAAGEALLDQERDLARGARLVPVGVDGEVVGPEGRLDYVKVCSG